MLHHLLTRTLVDGDLSLAHFALLLRCKYDILGDKLSAFGLPFAGSFIRTVDIDEVRTDQIVIAHLRTPTRQMMLVLLRKKPSLE